jgi:hypothetical protein
MGATEIAEAISQYGFPIIAALGLGYFVYYIWTWATEVVDPVIASAQMTLIKLIDRVRMLDNDMIRLNTKLTMILELKARYEQQTGEKLDFGDLDIDEIQRRYSTQSATWKQPDNTGGDKKAPAPPKK